MYEPSPQPVAFPEGRRGFVSIEPGFVAYEYLDNLDRVIVFSHFGGEHESYKALAGTPAADGEIALPHAFKPPAARYEKGERSEELYDAMMAVEKNIKIIESK